MICESITLCLRMAKKRTSSKSKGLNILFLLVLGILVLFALWAINKKNTQSSQAANYPFCVRECQKKASGRNLGSTLKRYQCMRDCRMKPTPTCVPFPDAIIGVYPPPDMSKYCPRPTFTHQKLTPTPACVPTGKTWGIPGTVKCVTPTPIGTSWIDCTESKSDVSCPSGYKCVKDCGLPVGGPVTEPPSSFHCLSSEQMDNRNKFGCPVCLSSSTMIDTPVGVTRVTDIRVGQTVWTKDVDGNKVGVSVVKIARTPVNNHKVIHFVLSDKRELWVSAKHPTFDSRTITDLNIGESYDGGIVVKKETIPYNDKATYDILPGGETGLYWANGILLGSTLR